MILFSTRDKMRKAGKPIYRVTWPASVVSCATTSVTIPEYCEDFATYRQAEKATHRYDGIDYVVGTIQEVRCY